MRAAKGVGWGSYRYYTESNLLTGDRAYNSLAEGAGPVWVQVVRGVRDPVFDALMEGMSG